MKNEPLPTEFADIFRRLSPTTVQFLNQCFEGLNQEKSSSYLGSASTLFYLIAGEHAQFGTGSDTYELVEGTIRQAMDLGLIEGSFAVPGESNTDQFYMTSAGKDFVRACRAAGLCK